MTRHMSSVQGNCQWGYNMYGENASYISSSFAAPSASVIKLFIMEYAYNQMCSGEIKSDDIVSGTKM